MKKFFAAILVLMLLPGLLLASANAEFAVTSERADFFAGPGERYWQLCSLPEGTEVIVNGVERGGGTDWAFVEFSHAEELQYGYVDLRSLDASEDQPEIAYDPMSCFMNGETTVYGLPSDRSIVRGIVKRHRMINALGTVTGSDGKFYEYIEYLDRDLGALCRGYIPSESAGYTGDPGAIIAQDFRVVDAPSDVAREIGQVDQYEIVGYLDTENAFARIQFFSAARQDRCYGYVPVEIVETPYIQ